MRTVRAWTAALLVLLAVAATLLAVRLLDRRAGSYTPEDKLDEALAIIRGFYIGERDEEELTDAAIDGMVASLGDRWSYYMTAEETQAYQTALENSYQGIGLVIAAGASGGVEVQSVYRSSPAGEAGLLPGSRLLEVNGTDLRALQLDEATLLLREAIASGQVALTLACPDGETRSYTLTPGRVETEPVHAQLLDSGCGLITISNFEDRSAQEAIAAVDDLIAQGAKGLIFDVRNNPGGQLAELLELLDHLLPEGTLFISKAIDGTVREEPSDAACVRVPMAVLVNGSSYSAAEFFAAALRDYDWAETVGEQTSGKGRAQVTVFLKDGSALHLSNIEYYTPSGESLVGKGLTPDIPAALPEEQQAALYYGLLDPAEDAQLQAAQAAVLALAG